MKQLRGGYSLIELVVTLVILAILTAVALPGYRQSILRANRAVATLALLEVATRQQRYWQERQRHSESFAALGLADPYCLDATADAVGCDRAIYALRLDWLEGRYLGVSAVAVNAQAADADCAVLIYGRLGERRVAGGYSASPQRCWR